jgi:hypothetical protein
MSFHNLQFGCLQFMYVRHNSRSDPHEISRGQFRLTRKSTHQSSLSIFKSTLPPIEHLPSKLEFYFIFVRYASFGIRHDPPQPSAGSLGACGRTPQQALIRSLSANLHEISRRSILIPLSFFCPNDSPVSGILSAKLRRLYASATSSSRQAVKREFFEGKFFHESSSSEVTKMTHLILHERWSDCADATEIGNWIEDIHPESTFDVLTVDIDGVEEGKVHALFQNLDKFNGLISLVVRGRFSQSMIDSIRCASLRQLNLHHPAFIPWIGSHASCPKLESIRYLLPSRRPRIMNEDEMLEYYYNGRWDCLQQLMNESINFVFLQGLS